MNRLIPTAITVLLLLAHGLANAQDRDDPTPLLRSEADVHITTPGLTRIPLGVDVLSEAADGLSDVRIFDAQGSEVPWLLAGTVRPRAEREAVPLVPLEATRDRRRHIYDRYARHETFLLSLPEAPVGTHGWDLLIEAPHGTFTRRYRVIEVTNGVQQGERSRGTVFRFASPRYEKRRIELGAGGGTFLVAIEGDDYDWLSPTFSAVAARPPPEIPTLALPLVITSRDSVDGHTTVLRVARPAGVIPSALRIETTSTTFHRRVEVVDVGFGGETPSVGGATAYRVADPVDTEHLEVPLRPVRGDALEIRITNEDGPPLDDLAVVAIVRQPILVADLPGDATLRFGGGRLRAPRYDLARLAGGELGRRLVEADLPVAEVSPTRPNPRFDAGPALGWAMRAGRPVDLYRYRHTRSVFLDPSDEGLSRMRVSAEDLAVLSESLFDLRVADTSGASWPYLLERDAGVERVALVASVTTARGASAYSAPISSGAVPVRAVFVTTSATFVDRDYALYGRAGDGEERLLAEGRLTRRPDLDDQLRIAVQDVRASHLRLVIRDGGDAPLADVSMTAEVPVPDLYVAAPAGDYAILMGGDGIEAPQYEVQRARELILSVTPADAYPRSLQDNPDYMPPRRVLHVEDWVLWAVLLLAILILTLLTIRAVRREPGPETPEETEVSGEPHSA